MPENDNWPMPFKRPENCPMFYCGKANGRWYFDLDGDDFIFLHGILMDKQKRLIACAAYTYHTLMAKDFYANPDREADKLRHQSEADKALRWAGMI